MEFYEGFGRSRVVKGLRIYKFWCSSYDEIGNYLISKFILIFICRKDSVRY